jgi:hypothetical protein
MDGRFFCFLLFCHVANHMTFDVQKIRAQFPILTREINGYPLAYLDNAASARHPYAGQ